MWTKDNYAQWGTYRALVTHQEIDPVLISFAESEKLKMPGLAFYVMGATSGELEHRADIVARQIYQFHVVNYKPAWQDKNSVNSITKALKAIKKVLLDKAADVKKLSDSVDAIFKYNNE